MTDIDRAAIRARAEAATEGPWDIALSSMNRRWALLLACGDTADAIRLGKFTNDDDAEFIAHARTDIPALLAALENAERERDALAAVLDQVRALMCNPDYNLYGERFIDTLDRILATAPADTLEAVKAEAAANNHAD